MLYHFLKKKTYTKKRPSNGCSRWSHRFDGSRTGIGTSTLTLSVDVSNSVNRQVPSVFSYINHSFRPNVRCIPDPDGESVVFETLRRIESGESLSFDYTSTEEPLFAEPFVDIETGHPVGMDK